MTFATQLATSFTALSAVYDDASVTQVLSWAQSFVEEYCNRTFDLVTDDVAFIDPKPHRQGLLPAIPVTDVSEVQALLPTPTGGMTWTTLVNFAYGRDRADIRHDRHALCGQLDRVFLALAGRQLAGHL
jgi:hypothetical protein